MSTSSPRLSPRINLTVYLTSALACDRALLIRARRASLRAAAIGAWEDRTRVETAIIVFHDGGSEQHPRLPKVLSSCNVWSATRFDRVLFVSRRVGFDFFLLPTRRAAYAHSTTARVANCSAVIMYRSPRLLVSQRLFSANVCKTEQKSDPARMLLPPSPPGRTPPTEPARSGAWTTCARSCATTRRIRRSRRRRCHRWNDLMVGFRVVGQPV